MNSGYITKEEVLSLLNPSDTRISKTYIALVREEIKLRPSADVVEVKHGRWIKSKAGGVLCSECYSYAPDVEKGSFTTRRIEQEKSAYCPCCGAKMDGDDNECK